MIKTFQHQNPLTNFSMPRPEPKPQHGQKPDVECLKVTERRSFEPRPGH